MEHLERVLSRLSEYGLVLKLAKCSFAADSIKYLGHIVSDEGIACDPDKLTAVSKYPKPRNVRELRGFVGFASYYRRFIKNFAKHVSPLTRHMGEKDPKAAIPWKAAEEVAFETIKQKLLSAPVLAHPDWSKPFTLQTDASDVGIGAVLEQQDDDDRSHPVAYISRAVTKAEAKWTVHEREALAIVWACEQLRPYLAHAQFTIKVETDHSNLRYMFNATSPPRLARWGVRMSEFHFDLTYKKGLHNRADAPSRAPAIDAVQEVRLKGGTETEHRKWRIAQEGDVRLKNIMVMLQTHEWVDEYEKGPVRGKYRLDRKGVLRFQPLHFQYEDIAQCPVVVPRTKVKEIMDQFHQEPLMGHLGAKKMHRRMAGRFYWLKMRTDLTAYARGCITCRKFKSEPPRSYGVLQPFLALEPFAIVHCDFVGPLPVTKAGNQHICVFVDKFSRWVEVVPTKGCTAQDMIDAFIDAVVARHGCPERLVTDRGACFVAELSKRLFARLGTRHIKTTAYNPQANAQVERVNKVIKACLAAICDNVREWDRHLQIAAFAYRTAFIDAIGITPFELIHGRAARLPTDLLFGPQARKELAGETVAEHERLESFKDRVAKQVREAWKIARAAQWIAKRQMMRSNLGRKDRVFKKGDLVFIWKGSIQPHQKLAKFGESRVKGPWPIDHAISPVLYSVERLRKNGKKVLEPYHVNHLIPYEQYQAPSERAAYEAEEEKKLRDRAEGRAPDPEHLESERKQQERSKSPDVLPSSPAKSPGKSEEKKAVEQKKQIKELGKTYYFPDEDARRKANESKQVDFIEEQRITRKGRRQFKVLWRDGRITWEYEKDLSPTIVRNLWTTRPIGDDVRATYATTDRRNGVVGTWRVQA